jgi:hypothetical protein
MRLRTGSGVGAGAGSGSGSGSGSGGGAGSGRRAGTVAALAAAAVALVVAGVLSTVAMLRPDPYAGSLDAFTGPGPFAVGQPVRTSVGVIQITGVDRLDGLSTQDLSSANHGVANLVPPDQSQVQATLRLTNDTARPVDYSPSQILLRAGGHAPVKAMSSTLPESRLGAGVSLEGTLGFVATRNGSALRLELPGVDGPAEVDLGRIDRATPQTGHEGHHG